MQNKNGINFLNQFSSPQALAKGKVADVKIAADGFMKMKWPKTEGRSK
jgi:hypothetical protein